MKKTTLLYLSAVLLTCAIASAQVETVLEWNFDKDGDKGHWTGANHLKDVQVKDGLYRAVSSGHDPFLVAAGFEFPTKPSQALEFRYKTNRGGSGELYFTNTTEGPYGGFSPKKLIGWKCVGDEQWHVARIFPGWNDEKKIIKLRIDFPNIGQDDVGKVYYEVDWIRVVDMNFKNAPAANPDWDFTTIKDGWKAIDDGKAGPGANGWSVTGGIESNPMTLDVDEHGNWISLEMSVDRGKTAMLTFFSDSGVPGSVVFPIKADGKSRWYNVDGLDNKSWRSKIHLIQLTVSDDPTATATVRRLLVSDNPQGPADVDIDLAFQPEAINRTDKPTKLAIRLRNGGGKTAEGIKIEKLALPSGVKVVSPSGWENVPALEPLEKKTYEIELQASKPYEGKISFEFSGPGAPVGTTTVPVRFEKNLNLPKADYVPKPTPVTGDFEIGALYYPGWYRMEAWERIFSTHPERKPVLGWYDEANPEVIDWQIKWSLENGIGYYLVDWYWNKGHQHNDHWVKGFQKARYKSMFKWAMMWANHNGPGSHSEEDQRAVTKFWIENYFNTPEYYTKDGRPVVMIWSAQGMDNDMIAIEGKKGKELKKGEGVKRLLDISQEMAKAAGYKGIYFIAMKWPEASTNPADIQWLADAGFEMTSIYHFMHHGGKAKNPRRFDFELVIDASRPYWEARRETGIIPFLPNLSTGWDSRPWHGDKQTIIDGRTVAGFKRICEDYKKFAEETGIKSMVLAPTNEWGEGSYAEPNAEYGFGMFETVRDTFCKKPAGGWPLNYGPSDVGLGPYDFPPVVRLSRTAWDFQDGAQGWNAFMGIRNFKGGEGKLVFESTNHDPALAVAVNKVKADDFSKVVVRMKVTAQESGTSTSTDRAQLFWSTSTSPVSEANSVSAPVKIDGQFHDYVFPVKSVKTWRRQITSLRFDPLGSANKTIEIESIRFE